MSKSTSSKLNIDAAKELILDFFSRNNRPFNAKQVMDGLRGSEIGLGKTLTEHSLEFLVKQGSILSKGLNKQLVYWPLQKKATCSDSDIKELDGRIELLQTQLNTINNQIMNLTNDIKEVTLLPKSEQLDEVIEAMKVQQKALVLKLEEFKSQKPVNPESVAKIEKIYKNGRDSWKKRKRLYLDIEEVFVDNMGKDKFGQIKEDIGIEYDPIPFDQDTTSKLMAQNPKKYMKVANKIAAR